MEWTKPSWAERMRLRDAQSLKSCFCLVVIGFQQRFLDLTRSSIDQFVGTDRCDQRCVPIERPLDVYMPLSKRRYRKLTLRHVILASSRDDCIDANPTVRFLPPLRLLKGTRTAAYSCCSSVHLVAR